MEMPASESRAITPLPADFPQIDTGEISLRNPPSIVIQQPRERLLGRLGMGLFCSSVVAVVMNFAGLKWIIIHVFALFLSLFGGDAYEVHPKEAVKELAKGKLDHIREEAKKVVASAGDTPLTEAVDRVNPVNRAVTKIGEPVRQAGAAITEGAHKVGEKVKDTVDDVAEALDARRQRHEAEEKDKLLVQARVLGLSPLPGWSLATLRTEVTLAEKQAREKKLEDLRKQWNARYNGRCPEPGCLNPMKVSTRGTGRYLCLKCKSNVSAAHVRHMGPPPMPANFRGF